MLYTHFFFSTFKYKQEPKCSLSPGRRGARLRNGIGMGVPASLGQNFLFPLLFPPFLALSWPLFSYPLPLHCPRLSLLLESFCILYGIGGFVLISLKCCRLNCPSLTFSAFNRSDPLYVEIWPIWQKQKLLLKQYFWVFWIFFGSETPLRIGWTLWALPLEKCVSHTCTHMHSPTQFYTKVQNIHGYP